MKKLFILLIIIVSYLSGFFVCFFIYEEQDNITFIWNDDEESIPKDGSSILLEHTSNDTIYLGPLETETNSPEYQFTITDDSISITDFDRYVGTVKIEGELKQLLNKDNE